VRAFLFDLDGVLVDTRALVEDGWRRFAASRGRTLSDEELVGRIFGRRNIDVLVEVFGLTPDEARREAAVMSDKRAEVAAGPPLGEIPGAAAFVQASLAAGLPCAVASSAAPINVRLGLAAIGLDDAFPVVIDGTRVDRGKPAPDPYLAAARELGMDPAGCVVFEDSTAGVASARAADARCVGVASLGDRGLLAGADLVIDDFRGWTPEAVLEAVGP